MNDQRCYIKISKDKLIHNFNVITTLIPKECQVIPIIKANGYGLGSVEVAKTLSEYVITFAVAELEEARELRQAGINNQILVFGYTDPALAEELVKLNLIQSVTSLEYANALSKNLKALLKVHLKLDTGMHRLGFDTEEKGILDDILSAAKLPNIEVCGMFSHFCESDSLCSDFTSVQLKRFLKAVEELKARGLCVPFLHCANSAGILAHPDAHLSAVRPGLILYGAYPSKEIKDVYLNEHPDMPFKEAMTFCARIAQIRKIKKGESLSYNRTHTFDKDAVVAVVSAGYADGIPRSLSNIGEVTINSKRYKIVGNVCMDLLMVDITEDKDKIKVGDEVCFWGEDSISVDEYAEKSGLINYELYTGVSKRVVKIYE